MRARADGAYVQARLQARHGRRPGGAAWHALEASRTGAHALAAARSGALAPWIDGLDEGVDVHALEAQLRRRWVRHVDEVASWQAVRWRAATRWFGLLPHLELVAARQRPHRGAGAPPAASIDDRLAVLAGADLADDPEAWRATPAGADLAARWRAVWRERLPVEARDDADLHRPAEILLPALRGPSAGRPLDEDSQQQALERHFRRHAGRAPAVFAHLAMVHLDLERLRGELVVRWVFDARMEA